MGWRHLLFSNWPVDPDVVAAHLPEGLEVDTHDGWAWLSVVPFTNVAIRPRGLPRWLGWPLPELNLRTYVTCDGQPGVYFCSLDAEGAVDVVAARLAHRLPYFYARIDFESDGDLLRFRSRRRHPGAPPCAFDCTWEVTGDGFRPDPGSLEHFLVERYRYYAAAPDGSIRYAEVDHEPWRLFPARATFAANDLFRANGFAHPESDPVQFCSPGLDVRASANRRFSEGG